MLNVQLWINQNLANESAVDEAKALFVKIPVELAMAAVSVGIFLSPIYLIILAVAGVKPPDVGVLGAHVTLTSIAYSGTVECRLGDGSDIKLGEDVSQSPETH